MYILSSNYYIYYRTKVKLLSFSAACVGEEQFGT